MRAGSLRNFLSVQRKVADGRVSPGYPEIKYIWQDWLIDVPCDVEVRRGREHFDTDTKQRYSEDVWIFRCRYEELEGISSVNRIVHDGMKFDIKSMRPDAQFRRHTLVECTVQDATIVDSTPDESPPDLPPDTSAHAYTFTAGQSAAWNGYIQSAIGSIDIQPIAGATISSTVNSRYISGEGGVEISGAAALLQPILEGKSVFIDNVEIVGGEWAFSSTQAVWWALSGFPTLVGGQTYEIEIK